MKWTFLNLYLRVSSLKYNAVLVSSSPSSQFLFLHYKNLSISHLKWPPQTSPRPLLLRISRRSTTGGRSLPPRTSRLSVRTTRRFRFIPLFSLSGKTEDNLIRDRKIICRCYSSDVLEMALTGEYKERSEKKIHLKTYDPKSVLQFIRFLYGKRQPKL